MAGKKQVTIQYVIDDDVSKGLKKIRKTGTKTFNKIGKSAKKANRQIKAMATTNFRPMLGSLTRIMGIMGLGMGIKSIIDTRVEYENFMAVLESMEGSALKGQAVLDNLSKFAVNTPNQLNEVIQAYVKLKGVGIAPLNHELLAMSDLGAAAGKSILDVSMAIQGAMTGEMERLKALNVVASVSGDKITFTYKNQKTTIDKTNASIMNYLISLGKLDGVSGMSTKMMDTLGGAISNMKDSAYFAMNSLGELSRNGLVKVIKGVSTLLAKTPQLIQWFKDWAHVIKPVVKGLLGFFIISKITKMVQGLTIAVKALNVATKANIFVALGTGLVFFGVKLVEVTKQLGGFTKLWEDTGTAWGAVWGIFSSTMKIAWVSTRTIFGSMWREAEIFIQKMSDGFSMLGKSMKLSLSGDFEGANAALMNPEKSKKLDLLEKKKQLYEMQSAHELLKLSKERRDDWNTLSKLRLDMVERISAGDGDGDAGGADGTGDGAGGDGGTGDGAGGTGGTAGLGSGVTTLSANRNVKSVTLNITKLVENLNINTTTLKESAPEIKRIITEFLTKSLVDVTGIQQ